MFITLDSSLKTVSVQIDTNSYSHYLLNQDLDFKISDRAYNVYKISGLTRVQHFSNGILFLTENQRKTRCTRKFELDNITYHFKKNSKDEFEVSQITRIDPNCKLNEYSTYFDVDTGFVSKKTESTHKNTSTITFSNGRIKSYYVSDYTKQIDFDFVFDKDSNIETYIYNYWDYRLDITVKYSSTNNTSLINIVDNSTGHLIHSAYEYPGIILSHDEFEFFRFEHDIPPAYKSDKFILPNEYRCFVGN